MSDPALRPIDIDTAHQVVQQQLGSTHADSPEYDPRLAAGVCLWSSDPDRQYDGATVLATLADTSGTDVAPALYDLRGAAEASRRETRAYVLAVFAEIARTWPEAVVPELDVIVPRLDDPDPLVREAACATVAHLESHFYESWETLSDHGREQLRRALPLLGAQLAPAQSDSDDEAEWVTSFGIEHPERTFWGAVEAGTSRRSFIRCRVTYALALLAPLFPSAIHEHSSRLVELAVTADQPETRGYAVDALGRADATAALERVRDRACEYLATDDTAARGVSILHTFIMECPALLVDAAPLLADRLPALDARSRSLATVAILHAAVHG